MTIKFSYAELYTLPDDGFRKATFVDPDSGVNEWGPEKYDTIHLNRVAGYGWRVVHRLFSEPDNFAYLLEKENA